MREEDRQQAALVAAVLCGVGTLFCLPNLLVADGVAPISRVQAATAAAICLLLGVCCLAGRWRRITWPLHLTEVAGISLVTWVLLAAGGGVISATTALAYVWSSIYAFAYLGPRFAAGYALLATTQFTAALVVLGETQLLPIRVLITMGTITAAGAVVGVLRARIQRLAETDSLTGLPNRRAFEQALDSAIARRRAGGFTIALLDLDGFKQLNDTAGHEAGDDLLRDAAVAWQEVVRRGDLLARLGGDEFVVVLPGSSPARAHEVTRRLVEVTPPGVTTSVGVAVWHPGESARDTVRRADQALYRAKRTHPGTVDIAPTPALAG